MIKKSLLKIAFSLIIIGFSLAGLLSIDQTYAFFSDTGTSSGSSFTATTLDFSLPPNPDFSPEITPTQTSSRNMTIQKDGVLDFNYTIQTNNIIGDLCDFLNLSADLGGDNKYTGVISGLNYNAGKFGTVGGDWQFTVSLPDDDPSLQSQTCTFDFVFDGIQIGGVGFSNQETISNTVTSGTWVVPTNTWVQTTQADFESGVLAGVDTTTNLGDVMLSGAYSIDNNTIALWHLNEGSGSTAYDETTNNNDGTINGTINGAVWTSGKYNNALEFDGGDDYIGVPDSASLDITGQITVEAWIKADSWDNPEAPYNVRNIIDKGEHKTGKAYGLYSYDGLLHFRINKNSNTDTSGGLPSTGVWHHVAGTYDGSKVRLYIDGTKVGEKDYSGGILTNNESLYIGGGVDREYYFDGLIDEVRISNVARTSFSVDYFSSGTLESQSFDSGKMADWQSLEWNETVPTGTNITFRVATASVDPSNPASWTWQSFGTNDSPIDLSGLPETRYIKWEATLTTTDITQTPVLSEVRVIYYPGTASEHIVLNEFLPNPSGANPDYGFDFGEDNDLMPKGEWVEIYNKAGGKAVDLAGWYIRDQEGNTKYITTSNTDTGSTIINSGEWLVVYMNGEFLDNTGDTIYLYDLLGNLINSYSYDLSGYCTLEPTPGDENDETASGSCPTEIPGNKSYARIPDGIGDWYDPIPTPGGQNKLEEEIEELEPEPELLLEEIIEEIPLITTTTTTSTIPDVDILENSTSTITTIPEEIIPEQTTATTTEPLVAGAAASTTTVPMVEEPITTTTTTEPPVEESDLTTATTTESLIEETTTTTTTIPEETIITTTIEPPVEEPPMPIEEPITTITTTTTTQPPVEETIPTTTTITTPEPPVSTDAEADDLTAINLINIYFV